MVTHETSSTVHGASYGMQNTRQLRHSCLIAVQNTLQGRHSCVIIDTIVTHETSVQCPEQQESSSNITKDCALPRNCKVKIRWKSPSIASGPIEKRLGRDWSMILFGELTRPIFGNAVGWKSNLFALVLSPQNFTKCCACCEKWRCNFTKYCACLRKQQRINISSPFFSSLLYSDSTLLFSALHVSRH